MLPRNDCLSADARRMLLSITEAPVFNSGAVTARSQPRPSAQRVASNRTRTGGRSGGGGLVC